jgi:hypothetical protein
MIWVVIVTTCVWAACLAAEEATTATRMWVVGWEDQGAGIVAGKTVPTEFTLTLPREMSTPGWRIEVDSVALDPTTARIVVKLTERKPDGIVAQVLTTTRFEIPLGHVAPGRYFVEIWARPAPDGPHQPAHALVVQAH